MKKALLIAASALAAFAMAAPASADSVSVGGTVPEQCSISGATLIDFGVLANDGTAPTQNNAYTAYCNVQFVFSFGSLNGRLINTSVIDGTIGDETGPGNYNDSDDFYAALDYTVGGLLSTAVMPAGVTIEVPDVQEPVATSVSLPFATIPLSSGYLTAGTYQDTFTITLTAQGL